MSTYFHTISNGGDVKAWCRKYFLLSREWLIATFGALGQRSERVQHLQRCWAPYDTQNLRKTDFITRIKNLLSAAKWKAKQSYDLTHHCNITNGLWNANRKRITSAKLLIALRIPIRAPSKSDLWWFLCTSKYNTKKSYDLEIVVTQTNSNALLAVEFSDSLFTTNVQSTKIVVRLNSSM
jgi:hypothetical protein